MNSFEMFKRRVASRIENSQVTIDRFRHQIINDEPAHAFDWADDAMKAAASHKVFKAIEELAKSLDLGCLETSATNEVLRRSRYPQHSTSPVSNAMYQYELAAWSEALELITEAISD